MTNRMLFMRGFLLTRLAALPAHGQVISQLRAARFYPPNMPNAPTTPQSRTLLRCGKIFRIRRRTEHGFRL